MMLQSIQEFKSHGSECAIDAEIRCATTIKPVLLHRMIDIINNGSVERLIRLLLHNLFPAH